MKNLTCIVCPAGCSLTVEEGPAGPGGFPRLTVTGNRCSRGAVYAQEEFRAPRRVVTATCRIMENTGGGPDRPGRLPVKSTAPCPRERIPALLADIYRIRVKLPVKAGDILLSNWQGSGINVAAARSLS
jgi:CxxC motif-containing protein